MKVEVFYQYDPAISPLSGCIYKVRVDGVDFFEILAENRTIKNEYGQRVEVLTFVNPADYEN